MKTIRKQSGTLTRILETMDENSLRRTRDRMLVASRIDEVLKAKNISQKTFAAIVGRSESEVSEWLSGDRNFTIDTLSDISNCLGVDFLNLSFLLTKRVSKESSTVKIAKTRTQSVYGKSETRILFPAPDEWQTFSGCDLSVAL